MDTRKLQKTGGSSLIVTLPKKWVDAYRLQDKDLVKVSTKAHVLLMEPFSTQRSVRTSTIDLHNLSQPMLIRELFAHYISGVDEISIKNTKFTPEERSTIRSLCNNLIGFELIDETSEKITIKNVFDQTKFPLSQNIEKMFLITSSMVTDAYTALRTQENVLAHDVINRDIEVDKLQIAITRQLYVALRKDVFSEDMRIEESDLIFYQNIATQLERIADHAVKIARATPSGDISGTPIIMSAHVVQHLTTLLESSRKMVESLNKKIAHTILDSSMDIENQIYNKKTRKHRSSFAWDVLEDSLDRIRGYIMNMAEMTIDQAILKDTERTI